MRLASFCSAQLELVSNSFRERNGDNSKFIKDFDISKLSGLKKFKGASKLIIQNDKLTKHAEEILLREGMEAKIMEISLLAGESNLPGEVASNNSSSRNNVFSVSTTTNNHATEAESDPEPEPEPEPTDQKVDPDTSDDDEDDGPYDPYEIPEGGLDR